MARCTHCGNYLIDGDDKYYLPSFVYDGRIFCCEGHMKSFYGEEKLQSLYQQNAELSALNSAQIAAENARQARIRAVRSILFSIILSVSTAAAYFIVPAIPVAARFADALRPIAFVLVTALALFFTNTIRKRVVTNIIYNKLFNFIMTALVFLTLFFAGKSLTGLDLGSLLDDRPGFAENLTLFAGSAAAVLVLCLILRKNLPFGNTRNLITALAAITVAFTILQFMGISVSDVGGIIRSFQKENPKIFTAIIAAVLVVCLIKIRKHLYKGLQRNLLTILIVLIIAFAAMQFLGIAAGDIPGTIKSFLE
jgi:hypothetical protein